MSWEELVNVGLLYGISMGVLATTLFADVARCSWHRIKTCKA